jgi:hypothetical protein
MIKEEEVITAEALLEMGKFQRMMFQRFKMYCAISIKGRAIPSKSFVPEAPVSSLWMSIVRIALELDQLDLIRNLRTRRRDVLVYRQIFCYIAREKGYSYSSIGRQIQKDHATCIHSYRLVSDMLEVRDPITKSIYDKIVQNLIEEEYATTIEPSFDESAELESDSMPLLSEEQDNNTGDIQSED